VEILKSTSILFTGQNARKYRTANRIIVFKNFGVIIHIEGDASKSGPPSLALQEAEGAFSSEDFCWPGSAAVLRGRFKNSPQ
jgi:hypothetical protein